MEHLNKGEEERRHRLIILTDMENECDDTQTMVRLLKYADEVDIEGLITVTYCWLQVEHFPESIEDNDSPACLSEQPMAQRKWAENNIRRHHGLLGAMYSQRVHCEAGSYNFMDGGGSTCLMGLVNKGPYEPEEISWVGWGGPFSREEEQISAGQKDVSLLEEKIILKVTDDNEEAALSSYKRILINVI